MKPSRAVHSSIAICALALATSCSVPQQVPNPQAAGNCKCARISPAARATGSSSASTVWGALIRNRICSHTAEVFSVRRRAAEARDGTIYKVGLDGKERVLHRFAGGSDGITLSAASQSSAARSIGRLPTVGAAAVKDTAAAVRSSAFRPPAQTTRSSTLSAGPMARSPTPT